MSQHDLENKIDRRGEELIELERIVVDIITDNQTAREKVMNEINMYAGNTFYDVYVKRLRELIVWIDEIDGLSESVKSERSLVLEEQRRIRSSINFNM